MGEAIGGKEERPRNGQRMERMERKREPVDGLRGERVRKARVDDVLPLRREAVVERDTVQGTCQMNTHTAYPVFSDAMIPYCSGCIRRWDICHGEE